MSELRFHNGEPNFYEGNVVKYINNEPVATSYEEGQALVASLFDETDFAAKYANTPENIDTLIRVARHLNRHASSPAALTRGRLIEAYHTIDNAGGQGGSCGNLERLPPPTPQAPPARNAAGQFENPLVAEYHRMLDDPTTPASDITKRLRNDSAFREAVEESRRPKLVKPEVDPAEFAELRKFAKDYRQAPAIRFISGFVTIGDREYTKPELDAKVERAAEIGVL
jgi:hypothetical protein